MSSLARVMTLKDQDGDDNGIILISSITMKKVSNGWIMNIVYDNDDEIVEVFNTDIECIKSIIETLGIENEVKVVSRK